MRLDTEALYAAVDRQRRRQRLSWRTTAHHIGVSPSLFTKLGHGGRPDADRLLLILAWLGTTDLKPFITHDEPEEAP